MVFGHWPQLGGNFFQVPHQESYKQNPQEKPLVAVPGSPLQRQPKANSTWPTSLRERVRVSKGLGSLSLTAQDEWQQWKDYGDQGRQNLLAGIPGSSAHPVGPIPCLVWRRAEVRPSSPFQLTRSTAAWNHRSILLTHRGPMQFSSPRKPGAIRQAARGCFLRHHSAGDPVQEAGEHDLCAGCLPERQTTTLRMPQDFMDSTMFRVPSDIIVVGPERQRRKIM